ncbi:MAG: hypothetical protein AB7I50_09110 [Vicinamibacterales bacterium]
MRIVARGEMRSVGIRAPGEVPLGLAKFLSATDRHHVETIISRLMAGARLQASDRAVYDVLIAAKREQCTRAAFGDQWGRDRDRVRTLLSKTEAAIRALSMNEYRVGAMPDVVIAKTWAASAPAHALRGLRALVAPLLRAQPSRAAKRPSLAPVRAALHELGIARDDVTALLKATGLVTYRERITLKKSE